MNHRKKDIADYLKQKVFIRSSGSGEEKGVGVCMHVRGLGVLSESLGEPVNSRDWRRGLKNDNLSQFTQTKFYEGIPPLPSPQNAHKNGDEMGRYSRSRQQNLRTGLLSRNSWGIHHVTITNAFWFPTSSQDKQYNLEADCAIEQGGNGKDRQGFCSCYLRVDLIPHHVWPCTDFFLPYTWSCKLHLHPS